MTTSWLPEILSQKRKAIDALRRQEASLALAAPDSGPGSGAGAFLKNSLIEALLRHGRERRSRQPALLAELKRASPSAGVIRPVYPVAELARDYARAGATALSVLTDEPFFQGALGHLAEAREAGLPVLRKDFILDPLQVLESKRGGADAILLIARLLTDGELEALLFEAHRLGLEVLLEIHGSAEIERALAFNPPLLGVNHRDLDTLAIKLDEGLACLRELRRRGFPGLLVSESGHRGPTDIARAYEAGADAVLVGHRLLTQPDLGHAVRGLYQETPPEISPRSEPRS